MISNVIKLIDDTVFLIRSKDDSESYFGIVALHKFEFRFSLCLEITRYELQINEQISDLTADAIKLLFVFGTFEYYYRDFPSVYQKCSELFNILVLHNRKLETNDLRGDNGVQDGQWVDYFSEALAKLV